eukprot:gene10916-22783_t
MGCNRSKNVYNDDDFRKWEDQFIEMGLYEADVNRFNALHSKLFKSKSRATGGVLYIKTVMDSFTKDINPFSLKILSLFSPPQTGMVVNFQKFCCAVWNLGTIGEQAIGKCDMKLKCKDIDKINMIKMVEDICNDKDDADAQKIIKSIHVAESADDNGVWDLLNTIAFFKAHPELFQKIKNFQLKFHKNIFGISIWNKYIKKRKLIGEERLLNLFLQIHPDLFNVSLVGYKHENNENSLQKILPNKRHSIRSDLTSLSLNHTTPSNKEIDNSSNTNTPQHRSSIKKHSLLKSSSPSISKSTIIINQQNNEIFNNFNNFEHNNTKTNTNTNEFRRGSVKPTKNLPVNLVHPQNESSKTVERKSTEFQFYDGKKRPSIEGNNVPGSYFTYSSSSLSTTNESNEKEYTLSLSLSPQNALLSPSLSPSLSTSMSNDTTTMPVTMTMTMPVAMQGSQRQRRDSMTTTSDAITKASETVDMTTPTKSSTSTKRFRRNSTQTSMIKDLDTDIGIED